MGIQPLTKVTPHHPRGSGERVTSRHRGILPSGSPTSGESAKSVRGVFSAAPPEALRPLGDVTGDDLGGNPTSEKRALSQGMHTSENDHFYEVQKNGHIF